MPVMAGDLVRRQIKFRSVPAEFDAASDVDDDRRRARQIKFRSLAERAIEPKKHKDRQVNYDALGNSPDQPLISYATDQFY